MKTYLYVDAATLHQNERDGQVRPPIVVTAGGNLAAHRAGCRVKINGPCEIVYDKKGFNGAKVVLVTEAEVEVIREYDPS